MTTPKHAYDNGDKGRYYRHPVTGQDLVSVTNVLSVGFTKYGLAPWYANLAAGYALDNLPSIVHRSRTDRDAIVKEIAAAAERARDSAAELGTRIHTLADAHATGRQVPEQEGDREAGLYVAQYLRFLKDFDVDLTRDIVAAEMTVADPARGYAGTLDVIVRLALGVDWSGATPKAYPLENGERQNWLLDFKSSRTRSVTQLFPDNRLQLAALRGARECWLPDDTVDVMPSVSVCAVLNLRAKDYALIPVPAMTPDLKTFHAILDACRWLHTQWPGNFGHRPVSPAGRFKPKRGAAKKAAAAVESLTAPPTERTEPMPMPEDTFTNTVEDAAAYERERAESAGEFDDYYDERAEVARYGG